MPTQTKWPLRQALSYALKQIVLTQAVPAINAAITSTLLASNPSTIPQFSDANLYIGDVAVPAEPVLCFVGGARRYPSKYAGTFVATLTTQIRLKSPWVADSSPEDYDYLCSLLEDTLEDLFTCAANRVIVPSSPLDGKPLLPPGASFYNCFSLGSNRMKYPVKAEDGVTEYAGWFLMHRADVSLNLSRVTVAP